ncbi:hypothetical protein OHA72_48695 [Dactylosporangium sp. NBC_01737]|uniref:hypothetical protein n=1 Tax=Dactylosporangium sp. NBC_01737 TaxID=2975959 RepID=UPI002E1345B6|nr:hypothetical protein OHA72_48695 [Dactylosporangium sp. NBC_01737]
MSFDVFLQGFAGGKVATGRPEAAVQVLLPYMVGAPTNGYVRVQLPDGEADVYGVGNSSLMVNRAAGEQIWDLVVAVATAAAWVIVPVGCPTCIVDASHADELPDELRANVILIHTGPELLQAILSS